MLTLAASEPGPRLAYAWQVLGALLGPLPVGLEADAGCSIPEIRFEGRCLLRLPPAHPLLRSGFSETVAPEAGGQPFGDDLLALTFWLLTEYETRFAFPRDAHGRPVDEARWLVRQGLQHEPLIHRLAESLAVRLRRELPRLPSSLPAFRWELGFDLDWPYRYRGRSPLVHGAALLRDLMALDWASARSRLLFMMKGRDPYDVYDFIFESFAKRNSEAQKHLLFFVLLSAGHRFDTPYNERNAAYRQLIAQIGSSGVPVGIHPSYASTEHPEWIAWQAARLQELTGQPVTRSRQHFLRLQVPGTYRALIEAGIRHEYTGCYATQSGWRFGTSMPFRWYDVEREQTTDLWIHPVAAMDRTLLEHECHTPEASMRRLLELVDSCRRWGGTFHVLLHNDTLGECPPWGGWRKVFTGLLDELGMPRL